ncbi:6-bladed beta-propeller [Algoriphagus aquatilis]|uniref:6-bladed beta-propeller n=1 Tax=Algoriphagus aquatilis TaxID=490186 RepID=A0ABW0BZI8_9BACT
MKTIYINTIIYILIVSTSCSNRDEFNNFSLIDASLVKEEGKLISDFSDSTLIIPLETQKNSLLSWITNLKLVKDKIYISDINNVLIFDLNGNFLSSLGSKGDGPGEHGTIYSMAFDENLSIFYVASENKLISFDLNNNFLREKKFPFLLQYIEVIDGEVVLISDNLFNNPDGGFIESTVLYKLDSNFEIYKKIELLSKNINKKIIGGFPIKQYISTTDEGTFIYKPVFTTENFNRDTLFLLQNDGIIPFKRLGLDFSTKLDERGFKTSTILNINRSKDYITSEYRLEYDKKFLLYEIKKHKYHIMKGGIIDEVGDTVVLRPLNLKKNIFYYIKQENFTSTEYEEMNPLIGIVKLK